MRHARKAARTRRSHLYLVSFVFIALAVSGCRTATVHLPGEGGTWTADPGKCTRVDETGEIVITPGRLVAKDFTWARGDIEFKLYDPGNSRFSIAFYDDNFAKVREANSNRWFVIVDGKPVPISKSDEKWKLHRVHALQLGGEQSLIDKGYRALGGPATTVVGPYGLARKTPWVTVSESFKIGAWNHIRITVIEGLMTVWVNGRQGESTQTDRQLNGELAFEVFTGHIRLSDVRLRPLR